ncbi:MAG TPA: hypothetical protein VFO29_07680 [Candidatus Rubrimentiphilum sp.]|nr:hypothetical protein [Candidatus Rubrimentiphilum sp.]
MSAAKDERLLDRAWERLREYKVEKPLSEFLQRFPHATKAYLVGGFLRDLLRAETTGVATRPKDIDLIIDTKDLEAILKASPGYLSGTPLGGYRWKPRGTTFWLDIWQLHDTVWIKELRLPVTIESFLDGVDLNIDRVALELHTGEFFNGKCREALSGRMIEIDSRVRIKELMYDEFARALMASYKTGFSLTESLSKRIYSADPAQLRRRAVERLRADDYADEDIRAALRQLA